MLNFTPKGWRHVQGIYTNNVAVLKTGCQTLVCQFLPNLYTNFTKLSNTPLIRQCALICTHSSCILDHLLERYLILPGRIYKCHLTSGRQDSDRIHKYMCHTIFGNNQKRNTHLFCFLGFARRMFYPALFTPLYFIILVVAISFWWCTKKSR
jgi:hypothetical protein